jgi:hypothetical protein
VRRTSPRLAAGACGLALAVVAAVLVLGAGSESDSPAVPTVPGTGADPLPDPFAWEPDRSDDLARRAAAGNSHLLYALSPGGAVASAERTARWRPLVERAAADAGVDADALEGLVFLESAGREDAQAPGGLESAVGLTQILAETGANLLGMRVDVNASGRYTRRLARARSPERAEALRRARRRVDERFDPEAALAGTARYLRLARERFGREDLALVSYHMGIGNLEDVLRTYAERPDGAIRDVVEEERLSYTRVYFDSTPMRHAAVYRRLAALGDDSSNYLWKLAAAREVMRLWREDRPALERLASLHSLGAGGEAVLHPPDETPRFATVDDLQRAWDAGELVAVPEVPGTTGLRRHPRLNGADPPYRGLRPGALALALYAGAQVRTIAGGGSLAVTAAVRDAATDDEHTLHATGWAFDVARDYRSRDQALAFQFALDRLRSLNVISWARERDVIHITVGHGAEALLPLLDRVNMQAP